MSWFAKSPSNLAMIKYMGKVKKNPGRPVPESRFIQHTFTKHLSKTDKEVLQSKNLSLNPSLSYTLNHFVTKVCIEESSADRWSPFPTNPFEDQKLYSSSKKISVESSISESAQNKFLDFFSLLKRFFAIPGYYTIFSQNNFPTAIGTASSASSFSALTQAVYQLALDRSLLKSQFKGMTKQDLAHLSRVGSGSSCRSFFSPWCLWDNQDIGIFNCPWETLDHQLVVVDLQPKTIRSRQAHQRVSTSPHFKGRADRAKQRMKALHKALNLQNWNQCFQISYEEFLDMHSLFETSIPPFSYKTPTTQKVLDCVNDFWKNNQDGPLATMDAGANVHLLYRPDQKEQKEKIQKNLSDHIILSSL